MKLKRIFIIIVASFALNFLFSSAQAECDPQEDYAQLGIGSVNTANYSDALNYFTCAIVLDADNAVNYYYRAGTYFLLEDIENAISDYTLAIELSDENSEQYYSALYSRGVAHNFLNEHENAISDLTIVIDDFESANSLFTAHVIRASSYRLQGELDLALIDYSMAIEIDDTAAAVYANRGIVFNTIGDTESAVSDWFSAVEIDPNITDSFRSSVAQLTRLGLYTRALETSDEAIMLDAFMGNFRWENNLYRSEPNLLLGNNLDAILDANIAIEVGQAQALELRPEILLIRAEAYTNLEFLEQALNDVNEYIEIAPDRADGYAVRGNIYFLDDQFEEALSDYLIYTDLAIEDINPTIQDRIDEIQTNSP